MKENFYVTGGDIPEGEKQELGEVIERLFPTDVLITLDRNRPYDGQPWTDDGERGKQEVYGITMRDIKDCFIKACYDCNPNEETPKSIYDLDWENIDIIAVQQNLSCWIERYMGIFPNLPDELKGED